MIFILMLLTVLIIQIKRRARPVTFKVEHRMRLGCGCVLIHEEVSGTTNPCAAHQAMAERL